MKISRTARGLFCVVLAPIPAQFLYAIFEDGKIHPGLYLALLVAAGASFTIFSLLGKISSLGIQIIAGFGLSYLVFIGLVLVSASIEGNTAETLMWLPIMILFGIPFTAPLIGMCWLGSRFVFGVKFSEIPEQSRHRTTNPETFLEKRS